MTAVLSAAALPRPSCSRSFHALPCGIVLATATVLAALILAVALLDPFAPANTHPTPEMLAAWETMMAED